MRWWMCAGLVVGVLACGKKGPDESLLEGWHGKEEWAGQCYYPKKFSAMGTGERRMARQEALEAIMSQWRGEREDGVSIPADKIERIETTMLGKPELIEAIAQQNLVKCKAFFTSGSLDEWANWLGSSNTQLTANDCKNAPLNYTLFDYLDVGKAWQIPGYVCKDDTVTISGSSIDYYRIKEGGTWMNVQGDLEHRALGDAFPCTLEGCFEGTLIMRFTSVDGMQTIYPVGQEFLFRAPNHGKIEVMINDSTWFDNVFKKEGSVIHHTSIEYDGSN